MLQMFAKSIVDGMQLLKIEPYWAPTLFYQSIDRCHKTVYRQIGGAESWL